MILGPAFTANRICGYTPNLATFPEPEKASVMGLVSCKTGFFDKIMEKNIDNMDQVVFMGAGFDTRALKYCKGKNVKVFELDQENTQKHKIKALKKAGIEYDWITFVPIDFNQEPWVDKLIENGFDTSQKTFFFWEGVTGYLEEESVTSFIFIPFFIFSIASVISWYLLWRICSRNEVFKQTIILTLSSPHTGSGSISLA